MTVTRYDWSDALVEAQTVGIIDNGALTVGMKLAHAITWKTRGNTPSQLRWANELAASTVGLPRATLYRHLPTLKREGYLEEVNGNLVPRIPISHAATKEMFDVRAKMLKDAYEAEKKVKSHIETSKSQLDTSKSQYETPKSQLDNPYSVDTSSVDTYSVDSYSVKKAGADAPPLTNINEDQRDVDHSPLSSNDLGSSLVTNSEHPFASNSEEVAQSQYETGNIAAKRDW